MPFSKGTTFFLLLTFFVHEWAAGSPARYDAAPATVALVDSLNTKGGEFIRTNPDSALIVLKMSYDLARDEEYHTGTALSSFLLGNYYQNRGQLEQAYQYFYESVQLNTTLGNNTQLAECYNSIGDIFRRQRNYKEASKNYQLSLELAYELKDTMLIAENINNYGDVFRDEQEFDSAIIHYKSALAFDQKIDNIFGIMDGYNNLGDVYLYLSNYDEAIGYFNRALRLAESMDNQLEVADNLNKLGLAYSKLNDFETALFYSKLAATVSNRIHLTEELIEAYRNLTFVYQHLNRYDKALESHKLFTQFQDSLLDVRSIRQISELQFLYESERKDSEILLKEAELEAQSLQLRWITTAAVLLLILAVMFYRNFSAKQKANSRLLLQQEEIKAQQASLEEKNAMLRRINDEKNEIIGMVAHDLRAPIGQVESVVSLMQYEKATFSPDMQSYLDILDKAASRMKFMVSEILNIEAIENSSFDLDLKPVSLYTILKEEAQNYKLYADKKKLALRVDMVGDADCAIVDEHIYRNIVENLLSNAVKYSPGGRTVHISLRSEDRQVITSVRDEGPGLSQEDMKRVFGKYQKLSAKPTGGEASLGLGLSLVKKFTEAMGGAVWCESVKGEGAEFFVSFDKCISEN